MLYDESIKKDKTVMLEDAIDRLKEKTDLDNFSAGSVIRSILEVVYDDIHEVREDLAFSVVKPLISSAEGQYLNEIGKLVDVDRLDGETDENYRYRITKHTEDKAKANELAIRLACLSVDGVADIITKDYVRGTGTFDIYVITEDPSTPSSVISEVQSVIDETQAKGVDGRAVKPTLKTVDFTVQYTFYGNASEEDKRNLKGKAKNALTEHLNNIPLGGELIIKKIINLLMEIDRQKIKNVELLKMFIDDKEVIIGDKSLYWDERIYPKNIKIN